MTEKYMALFQEFLPSFNNIPLLMFHHPAHENAALQNVERQIPFNSETSLSI
jgi:hypothetical protein